MKVPDWLQKKQQEEIVLPHASKSKMSFSDVAGLEELKETLREEVIYPISHPRLSQIYKQRIGSGILLYGPPGCGKTYIVKALAGEIGWPLINASCGNLIGRYAGQTENNIHQVFEVSRKYVSRRRGGLILFLDEIDALGHARDNSGGEMWSHMVVATLLSELDGISSNQKIFVVGATNAPWNVDPAIKRPGRFDSSIFVPPPDPETRTSLFEQYTDGLPLDPALDRGNLAVKTKGYSCADIKELCDAAAEIPWKEAIKTNNVRRIGMGDFDFALDRANSSLLEWYDLVEKNCFYEDNKIFPKLSKPLEDYL